MNSSSKLQVFPQMPNSRSKATSKDGDHRRRHENDSLVRRRLKIRSAVQIHDRSARDFALLLRHRIAIERLLQPRFVPWFQLRLYCRRHLIRRQFLFRH
jgi:hypothetical protein